MNKSRLSVKMLILIFVFIPSLDLFWDIISWLHGYEKYYSAFQFLFASYYVLLSVFFTSDCERFAAFWENNPQLKRIYIELLHLCATFVAGIMKWVMIMLTLFSHDCSAEEIKRNKHDAIQQIAKYDAMSLEVRTLLIPGVVALILTIIIPFNMFSEQTLSIIQNVLNALVAIVGLVFVASNVTSNGSSE